MGPLPLPQTPRITGEAGSGSFLPRVDDTQKRSGMYTSRDLRANRGKLTIGGSSGPDSDCDSPRLRQNTSPGYLRGSFELTAYKIPKGEYQRLGPRDIATLKGNTKKISFIDESVKLKTIVPSPEKYIKNVVWCSSENNTERRKGMFLKDERVTVTDRIFK